MGEIANIWVKLGAKIDEFEKNMSIAQKSMEKVGQKFQDVGKRITIMGAAITGAIGLAIKQTADLGDNFNNLSMRTGISVEKLSAFKLACDKSGLSMDDFSTAMRGFSKSLTESLDKTSKSAKIFKALGVTIEDGKGGLRDTDSILLDVAEKFGQMKDGAMQATVAQELFGRAGMSMIEFLKMGKIGLQENIDRAKELGMTWTTGSAKAADKFKETLDELKGALTGVRNNIGNSVIPIFNDLAKSIADVIGKFSEWQKQNTALTTGITVFVTAIGAMLLGTGSFILILGTLLKQLVTLGAILGVTAGVLVTTVSTFTVLIGALTATWLITKNLTETKKQAAIAATEAAIAEGKLTQKLLDAAFAAGLSSKEWKNLTDKYNGNIVALAMAIKRGEEGTKIQGAFAEVCVKSAKAYDAQGKAAKGAKNPIDDLNKLFANGNKTLAEQIGLLTRTDLEKKLAQYKQALADYGKQGQLTGVALADLQKNIRETEDQLSNNNATLAMLGLKTLPQTQSSVEFLKNAHIELVAALQNGIINLNTFNKGIVLLNELAQQAGAGIYVFSDGVKQLGIDFDSILPPARDMSGAIEALRVAASKDDFFTPLAYQTQFFSAALEYAREQAGKLGVTLKQDLIAQLIQLEATYNSLKAQGLLSQGEEIKIVNDLAERYKNLGIQVPLAYKIIQIETKSLDEYFAGFYNDIAQGFANTIENWMSNLSNFKDFWKGIWNTIKMAFFKIIGEMLAKFIVGFIQKIMAGMNILDALFSGSSLGKAVSGVVTGLGALGALGGTAIAAGGVGQAIAGGTVGAIGASGGAVLIPAATGAAAGGLAAGIASVASTITIVAAGILALVGVVSFIAKLFKKRAGRPATPPMTFITVKTNEKSPYRYWQRLQQAITDVADYIADLSTYRTFEEQFGSFRPPGFNEEEVKDFRRIKSKRPIETPRENEEITTNPTSSGVTINVNLNGTIITDREYTRDRIIPEITNALKSNYGRSEIQRALGVA